MKTIFLILVSMLVASNAFATSDEVFVGEWINTDTQGIPRIVIRKEGRGYKIHAWGRCTPSPYDWKETDLHCIAESVGGKEYRCCFAKWQKNHADIYFVIKLRGTGSHYYTKVVEGKDVEFRTDVPQILIESITVFKDKSKRASYRKISLLHKKVKIEIPQNSVPEKQ